MISSICRYVLDLNHLEVDCNMCCNIDCILSIYAKAPKSTTPFLLIQADYEHKKHPCAIASTFRSSNPSGSLVA